MNSGCFGESIVEKDGKKIILCKKCGYKHVFPMYTETELETFYENIYAESTPSHLWLEKVYNIKKWKKCGSILDIGCWEGAQLENFVKDGWQCTGTELNKKAASVASCKGIDVHQVSIREFLEKSVSKKWDVINIAYILEHITNPLWFLEQVKQRLNTKGIIIIEVPNDFNPFQLSYIKKHKLAPYWISLPDHVNYFNKEELIGLMDKTGWQVIHAEASFPMEMFLLMNENYLEDQSIGKKSFAKVVEMESVLREYDPGLVSNMYSCLYDSGIGRSLVVYAMQKDQ